MGREGGIHFVDGKSQVLSWSTVSQCVTEAPHKLLRIKHKRMQMIIKKNIFSD
jgi:hypothetical protein